MIALKRIYESPSTKDGYRILVDRLWARGITKEKAKLDVWLKDVSPSNELRKQVHSGKITFVQFVSAYKNDLSRTPELLDQIKELEEQHGTVTLLYAAKNEIENNATALFKILDSY
jgi:uncharacterized protein YeaO (DUF488 family)